MVGKEELESSTFAVSERHSNQLNYLPNLGGADETQTHDPLNANQVLYQLSYNPKNLRKGYNKLYPFRTTQI